MALDDDIGILAGTPLFELLARDALRLISFAADRRRLDPGEVLFRRGERGEGGYVVLRGTVRVEPRDAGGGPVLAGPAALIGRGALFARGERPSDAVAETAGEVLRVSPTLMRRVLEEFPGAAAAIHEALAQDLVDLTGRLDAVRTRLLRLGPEGPPAG